MNESERLKSLGYPDGIRIIQYFHIGFSPISCCFNVLILYILLFKTSRKVGKIRYYIVLHHVANLATDLIISLLSQPVFFFPYTFYITTGFLNTFLPPFAQMIIILITIYAASCSSVIGLFFRYQSLLPNDSKWKIHSEFKIHLINTSFIFVFSSFSYVSYVLAYRDQKMELPVFLQTLPWARKILEENSFIYLSHDSNDFNIYILYTAVYTNISFFLVIGLLCGCAKSLKQNILHMSLSNIKRQRQYTFKIVTQLVISTLMMAGPSTYFTISCFTGWDCSFIYVFNNLFVLLLGSHPFVSSIYTLFAWTNYKYYFAVFFFPYMQQTRRSAYSSARNSREDEQFY